MLTIPYLLFKGVYLVLEVFHLLGRHLCLCSLDGDSGKSARVDFCSQQALAMLQLECRHKNIDNVWGRRRSLFGLLCQVN